MVTHKPYSPKYHVTFSFLVTLSQVPQLARNSPAPQALPPSLQVTNFCHVTTVSVLLPAVHLDSPPASLSYGQMKHPSLHNLGLRKVKRVQFVRDDNPKDPLEGGVLNRLLAMFHPAGVVMRRLDELRVILCLYEVIMLPLRLAFGTGYGLISGPRYALLHTNHDLPHHMSASDRDAITIGLWHRMLCGAWSCCA